MECPPDSMRKGNTSMEINCVPLQIKRLIYCLTKIKMATGISHPSGIQNHGGIARTAGNTWYESAWQKSAMRDAERKGIPFNRSQWIREKKARRRALETGGYVGAKIANDGTLIIQTI
jgi:hypothetical protein